MFAQNDIHHLLQYVGMLRRNIHVLMYIFRQIIQIFFSFLYHQFPVAHTDTYLVCFVKLPIKEFMLLLARIIPQRCAPAEA